MCRKGRFIIFSITFLSLSFQVSLLLAFQTSRMKSCYKTNHYGSKKDDLAMNADIRRDDDLLNRRDATSRMISAAMIPISLLPLYPQSSDAGVPEIDAKSGFLYFPKEKMLGGGGSDLTRGIKLQSREGTMSTNSFIGGTKTIGLLQTVYDTRFITYLTRFLLNFDEGAKSWWNEQDFPESTYRDGLQSIKQIKFGEFAESVEIGLVDYFLGPYGSYDQAVGLLSTTQYKEETVSSFFREMVNGLRSQYSGGSDANPSIPPKKKVRFSLAKQGILNLLALLKVRYSSPEAKRQLVILFSLISDPKLQPSDEIRSLLGEIDDASVSIVDIKGVGFSSDIRASSRYGGGYSKFNKPIVNVEPPPALGDEFRVAKIAPSLNITTRVLRIIVTDCGEGYTTIPSVQVVQEGVKTPCEACPIMGRNGAIDSIIILNPGFGYGGNGMESTPPQVLISAPPKRYGKKKKVIKRRNRVATAVAELEYCITGLTVIDGGNGYVLSEPPKVLISRPQEDPDWYISPIAKKSWTMIDDDAITAEVVKMESKNIVYDKGVTLEMQKRLTFDPSVLFPSTLRPAVKTLENNMKVYYLQNLPPLPSYLFLPSSQYRAFDPLFGAICNKPVTKSARSLTPGEYSRLALSGAVCTVLVRTALNPLELVKTKIQLKNDVELMDYTLQRQRVATIEIETAEGKNLVKVNASSTNIGTIEVIKSLIESRGFLSLFQSADITFLASVVFGSFGFGATELFRRSFSLVFFPEDSENQQEGQEIFLLFAAAAASIITSAAAAPFETLRVRSMGYAEPRSLSYVFSDFVNEKRKARLEKGEISDLVVPYQSMNKLKLNDLRKNDIGPFFSGFFPIVSRELPFAVAKFYAFDVIARLIISFINMQPQVTEPVQVGVGAIGLTVSAISGAIAGLAGAFVSHPADLILTLTSASKRLTTDYGDKSVRDNEDDWKVILKDILSKPGSVANLFVGLPARSAFFFMVIGLQFFLYDYLKSVFRVGSDDLTLVLDVFYAVRQGLQ